MSQPLEKNQCIPTPISQPKQGSGSLKQCPNPNGEQTIKEPSSLPKGNKVLKNIDKPEVQEQMEIIVCKLGNLRISEKRKILQVNLLSKLERKKLGTNEVENLASKLVQNSDPKDLVIRCYA